MSFENVSIRQLISSRQQIHTLFQKITIIPVKMLMENPMEKLDNSYLLAMISIDDPSYVSV